MAKLPDYVKQALAQKILSLIDQFFTDESDVGCARCMLKGPGREIGVFVVDTEISRKFDAVLQSESELEAEELPNIPIERPN